MNPIAASWSDVTIRAWTEHEERELQAAMVDFALRPRTVASASSGGGQNVTEGHGLRRFRYFCETVETGFKWGRHHFERMFHDKCIIALAETLLGDEWATHGMDIARERGWTLLSKMVIGTAPRRFGKSVSLAKVEAALCAALLYFRDGLQITEYNITTFSTGKRASQLLSNYVKKFLVELNLYEECNVITDNSESIVLERDGLRVIFMFVPSNPDTLRGINADFVGCEEFAFMDVRVWREVIVPLLGKEGCVIVGISTPVDSFNFFSKLITKTHPHTGQPLFLTAIMELACDRCKARDRAHLCRHKMKYLPPWKSRNKQDIMDMMLSDQVTTIARENMGVITDEGNSVIEKIFLERWFAADRFVPQYMDRADTVVIAIDPNGSDARTASEMAIVSIAMKWNRTVVSFIFVPPPPEKKARAPPTCFMTDMGH
jgi:hypothetical protein